MPISDRRVFLRRGSFGLAALGAGTLALRAGAEPTEASGTADGHSTAGFEIEAAKKPQRFEPTEDNILGPFHRRGAPFRGKITPPMEPGDVLVIRGRVWAHDTGRPLEGALLDIWQANAAGRYDNDDAGNPPKPGVFVNRARLRTDETGYYEYETIKPGRYQIGRGQWRPAHIHYLVGAAGYKTLVTQLYFRGDPYNERDQFIKPTLIIDTATIKTPQGEFQLGDFDIVLARADG